MKFHVLLSVCNETSLTA